MIKIKPEGQRDSRWGKELLGFNTEVIYNISNYGCLITCLSMVSNYYGEVVDVKFINKALKEIWGFANGGYYVWGSITKLYPFIKETLTSIGESQKLTTAQIETIRGALHKGFPVMLKVDFLPETYVTDSHYVLAVDYDPDDDNGFIINDPWTGTQREIREYFGGDKMSVRSIVKQFIIYEGPVSTPPEELPSDLEKCEVELSEMRESRNKWRTKSEEQEEELATKKEEYKEHVEALQKTMSEMSLQATQAKDNYAKGLKLLEDQKLEVSKELAATKKDKKELEEQLITKGKDIEMRDKKIESLSKELEDLKKEVDDMVEVVAPKVTTGKALWEAAKEPLRVLALAVIPFALAYFEVLPYSWAGIITAVLRVIDKVLHELGKASGNEALTRGLTQF